jgi:6-pyruvoyltetrahydropterin/6-carboxytetrahydropterin synthase
MVIDFSKIKRIVGGWIDANLDHRMLLHRDDPMVAELRRHGEPVYLLDVNPTAESIARLLYEYTASQGFPVTQVALWETADSFAVYRPDR